MLGPFPVSLCSDHDTKSQRKLQVQAGKRTSHFECWGFFILLGPGAPDLVGHCHQAPHIKDNIPTVCNWAGGITGTFILFQESQSNTLIEAEKIKVF